MTDKNILGNTNIENIVKDMLDQAVLDPYMLDFLSGYHRGVNDSVNRVAETAFTTFQIVKKSAEFPALIRCFNALEHRMAKDLLVIKSDLLRY